MKGFCTWLLAMTFAVTALAGEGGGVVATVNRDRPAQSMNSVLPPVINESYKYYEVSGCCEKDLQCDLKEKCFRTQDGKKYDSVTNWKMKWNYGRHQSSQMCTADSFVVTVDVVFNFPKWVRNGEAPQQLVDKWNNYVKNLMMHEQGHRDRTVEAADALTRAVSEMPPAATCDQLDREINSLIQARGCMLLKEQDKYDAETKHGATQGVMFP